MIYWLLFVFLDKHKIFYMDLLNYLYLVIVTKTLSGTLKNSCQCSVLTNYVSKALFLNYVTHNFVACI